MRVGTEADKRTKRGNQQREGEHYANNRRRHFKLDDHHAVERADQKDQRYSDRKLDERKPEQARQRQIVTGRIGKRQQPLASAHPERHQLFVELIHYRASDLE
jgi:hypothetical protein